MNAPHMPASRAALLARVSDHVCAQWALPWTPGHHDCMTFALGAADILAGTDFIARFGGRYDSPRAALRRLREAGHDCLAGPLDEHFSRIPPAMARPGDVCVFALPVAGRPGMQEEHYALCRGGSFEARLPSGRHKVDPATILAVFRVE